RSRSRGIAGPGPDDGVGETASRRLPGGRRLIRVLRRGRCRLRRVVHERLRGRLRHRVLRRLSGGEEPLGRQPVRVRHHHDDVHRAGGAPAEGALLRHRARARYACRLHGAVTLLGAWVSDGASGRGEGSGSGPVLGPWWAGRRRRWPGPRWRSGRSSRAV
ncbi:LOW QUALITY PROTEIN: integral membrane protein, partial [Streptomyces viridosporus ATCC 14672]